MMIAIAVATALLAVLAGVLLAAFDLAPAEAGLPMRRLSLVWVIGTSVTAAGGVAYAFLA